MEGPVQVPLRRRKGTLGASQQDRRQRGLRSRESCSLSREQENRANSPPQPRRGGRDTKKRRRSLHIGADGVVLVKEILANTTPSARSEVASRFLLERASTPPRLRRGVLVRLTARAFGSSHPVGT